MKLIFFKKRDSTPKKILIFRTGSIGDSICALPAIYSIRKNFPDARIDILTNSGGEKLISLKYIIDTTIINNIYDYLDLKRKDVWKLLRPIKYDLFIQLPQSGAPMLRQIRDILIAKGLGAMYAFGWQVASTQFLSSYQVKLLSFKDERSRLLEILELNNLKSYGIIFPIGIQAGHKERIDKILEENRITDKDKNIAMMVGAKRRQNRWPIEYFKEVSDYLLNKGFKIILLGGDAEYALAEKIASNKNVFNYCGKFKPLETAELLKNCKFAISNDTGPMHLSYAVGTPVIAIFSSRDYPNKWFPPENGKNIVFRNNNIFCQGCFSEECDDNRCLKEIKPANIIAKLDSLILSN
jgi:ADP-heptose:LPS heptosyltransferase